MMTTATICARCEIFPALNNEEFCRFCRKVLDTQWRSKQKGGKQMTTTTTKSDFDQVFEDLEAPDYPATCDNCGAEGTNASMETHECGTDARIYE